MFFCSTQFSKISVHGQMCVSQGLVVNILNAIFSKVSHKSWSILSEAFIYLYAYGLCIWNILHSLDESAEPVVVF